MFCKKCGKKLSDNVSFCTACGAQVRPLADKEVLNNVSGTGRESVLVATPIRKNRRILLPVLCVAGFLLGVILAIIIFFIQNKRAGEQEARTSLAELKVGDSYFFGQYEQDGNSGNGTEQIEWIVLKKDGEDALLISKNILDTKPYNGSGGDITWEDSSIRKWLNDDFYNTAFDARERMAIMLTRHNNPDSYEYYESDYQEVRSVEDWAGSGIGAVGGEQTEDFVFLLSWEEALGVLSNDKERQSQGTYYANSFGLFRVDMNGVKQLGFADEVVGNGLWWLRSPGGAQSIAMSVYYDGRINSQNIDCAYVGIRPVVWITERNMQSE